MQVKPPSILLLNFEPNDYNILVAFFVVVNCMLFAHNHLSRTFFIKIQHTYVLPIYTHVKLGIYLTVTLLGICSKSLLSMNGSEIRIWMERVAAGSEDWYKLANQRTAANQQQAMGSAENNSENTSNLANLTWTEFTRGWLYATDGTT